MADTGNRGFGTAGSQRQTGFPNSGHAEHHDEGGLAGAASAVKDKAQDLASSVASRAEDAWDSTRQGVQYAASAVSDTAIDTWSDVMSFMRRYPFATLFIGFGMGFLLSRLVEGRSMGTFGHWDFGHSRGHDVNRSQFGS